MRNQFFEYYKLNEAKIQEVWNAGLFVFDTNVLINLYRYTENTKNSLLSAMDFFSDRLWIPYQIAHEYHENRLNIIFRQKETYIKLTKYLGDYLSSLNLSDFERHPYIDVNEIRNKVQKCIKYTISDLQKKEKAHPDYELNDTILDKITSLFEGKVGDDFTNEDLKSLFEDGKNRYASKVPPGYSDLKNKKDAPSRSLYGDLIVWKQIINKAAKENKNIIFVTGDIKEDWFLKISGRTIGPRIELLKEFQNSTGNCNILIYRTERFLEYANNIVTSKIEEESINEVKEIREQDEYIYSELYGLVNPNYMEYVSNPAKTIQEHLASMTSDYTKFIQPPKTMQEHLASITPDYTKFIQPPKTIQEHLASMTPDYTKFIQPPKTMQEHLASMTPDYTKFIQPPKTMQEHLVSMTPDYTKFIQPPKTMQEHLASMTSDYTKFIQPPKTMQEHLASMTPDYTKFIQPPKTMQEHLASMTPDYFNTIRNNELKEEK